jgi:hypothetical protein
LSVSLAWFGFPRVSPTLFFFLEQERETEKQGRVAFVAVSVVVLSQFCTFGWEHMRLVKALAVTCHGA